MDQTGDLVCCKMRNMKTYGQFCPVAQALEVLGERWTLLVVRELLMGSTHFSQLAKGVPLMSRTLLSLRLRSLQEAGVVERRNVPGGPEYHLTKAGAELRPIVESIGYWGKRFVSPPIPEEHLDPKLLMWDMQRRLHRDRMPRGRTTVLFRFSDARRGERRFWMCVGDSGIDICLTNPGFEVDVTLDTDVRTLTDVWMGNLELKQCIRNRSVVLTGTAALTRAFPDWLALSVFADAS
jgi:DNA-binding HxlR family transcriptional regulator